MAVEGRGGGAGDSTASHSVETSGYNPETPDLGESS